MRFRSRVSKLLLPVAALGSAGICAAACGSFSGDPGNVPDATPETTTSERDAGTHPDGGPSGCIPQPRDASTAAEDAACEPGKAPFDLMTAPLNCGDAATTALAIRAVVVAAR